MTRRKRKKKINKIKNKNRLGKKTQRKVREELS